MKGHNVAPRLLAVIGRQRSGSSVLRHFIGSSTRSRDLGEVFHGLTDRKMSFWGFLHTRASADAVYRYPGNWILAWQEFIEQQSDELARQVLSFDVKKEYFQLVLRTNGAEADFFFASPETKFIHLRRRNTAAQVISRHIAAATNVWSRPDPAGDVERLSWYSGLRGAPPPPRSVPDLTIDPAALLREVEAIHEEDRGIEELVGHKFSLRLDYEDLFDESGNFAAAVTAQISGITGIDETEFQRRPLLLRQRKMGVLDGIANAADIVAAFRRTKHEWMLTQQ